MTWIPDVYRRLYSAVVSESGTLTLLDLHLCRLRRGQGERNTDWGDYKEKVGRDVKEKGELCNLDRHCCLFFVLLRIE